MRWTTCLKLLQLSSIMLLSAIGCNKEDHKPQRPSTSRWLLSKVYFEDSRSSFLTEEFIYNGKERPQLAMYYNDQHAVVIADTLLYDVEGKLSQMRSWFAGGKLRTKDVHYTPGGWIDTIRVLNPRLANSLSYLITYKYNGDFVKQYFHSTAPGSPIVDSISYVYDNRNLREWRIDFRYNTPFVVRFPRYDDCYNIYSYLNMNVYLPWLERDVNPPFLSRNNYLGREQKSYTAPDGLGPISNLYSVIIREYQIDSLGLVKSAVEKSPNGGMAKLTYEYISIK